MKQISTLILFIFSLSVSGQITFEKTYGNFSWGRANTITSDSGYVIAGNASYSALDKVYLVKTDQFGDTLWTNEIGSANYHLQPSGVIEIEDGLIICGVMSDQGFSYYRTFALKTDTLGKIIWSKSFVLNNYNNLCVGIIKINDSTLIINGTNNGFNPFIIKIDTSGNIVDDKIFSFSNQLQISSISNTPDGGWVSGGYLVVGGLSNLKPCLIKCDSAGNIEWANYYDNLKYFTRSAKRALDGGYVLAGGGTADDTLGTIIKTDSIGNPLWVKTFDIRYLIDIYPTSDSGFIISGTHPSTMAVYSVILIKTDSNGDTTWTRAFGTSTENWGVCVKETFDKGYVISGTNGVAGNLYLIKTDSLGLTGCNYPPPPITTSSASVASATLSSTVSSGMTSTNITFIQNTISNISIVCPVGISSVNEVVKQSLEIKVFPNPAQNSININSSVYLKNVLFEIYDVVGKKIFFQSNLNGYVFSINCDEIIPGIYFLKISEEGNYKRTMKVLIN